MAHVKSQHYWRQLRSVLTAGQWDARAPAKDYHARPISWSELLRKFHKHCPGHQDVAEIASQTQALSLLISANADGLDGNSVGRQGVLVLGVEGMLAEERVEEAMTGYSALKQLDATHSDSTKAALAYYAFALRRPSECLNYLSQVKDLSDAQGFVSSSGPPRSAPATLRVPGASSNTSLSSSWTGSFVSAQSSSSIADIDEGRAWSAVERIRSICIKGMSQEVLNPDEPHEAFSTYLLASSLVANVIAEIPSSVPTAVSTLSAISNNNNSFLRYRELWRWIERSLRRAIIVGARLCDVTRTDGENGALWQLFQQYQACSAQWPSQFRPEQRSAVAVLHLRALISRARVVIAAKSSADRSHRWVGTARSVIYEYRAILSGNTTFSKAGERNSKVEDLVDLCVAVWEADGAVGDFAGWVIDVLWWATRLTFNSHAIFRHMSRLLYVAGDPELAKRTLRLYVQIVSKAHEAMMAQEVNTSPDSAGALGSGQDVDTDLNWVQTLVHGSRMFSRLALVETDVSKAVEEAREAGLMLEKAKTRLDYSDKVLVAGVHLAEAIWNVATAYTEQDPWTRTTRFQHSLSLLHAALELDSTASTHHHLALAYIRPGTSQNLQTAIIHARAAVETDNGESRHWHLLGLLLTAAGDWRAAKEILDMGMSVSDAELENDDTDESEAVSGNGHAPDGVHVYDFGSQSSKTNGHPLTDDVDEYSLREPARLLEKDATELTSSSLLAPLGDRPSSSRQEIFEHALQLRMTQLMLTEFVEGPEGSGGKWVEIFQWFSDRRTLNADDRRLSIDSRLPSQDLRPTSVFSSGEKRSLVAGDIRTSNVFPPVEEQPEVMPLDIPITVTPASPMHPSPAYSQDQLNGDLRTIREGAPSEKQRSSIDTHRGNPGKKVREVFISGVHKGRARVTTISKKIGHNVGRHNTLHLKRSNSAPDFRALLAQTPYQASSIHLRQHLSIYASQLDLSSLEAPPPPPPPPLPSPEPTTTLPRQKNRAAKERRLLSNLWLMSSATFRRLGKIEQAKGAIQEAEVRDESNPAVWVQLGLYYLALDDNRHALEAFQKALFISPNDVSATIHLCRVYLVIVQNRRKSKAKGTLDPADRDNVDLAVGLLSELTKGAGWDVPEAWYFLGKMYGLQGRQDRERECLCFALTLTDNRPLRDAGAAIGWCL